MSYHYMVESRKKHFEDYLNVFRSYTDTLISKGTKGQPNFNSRYSKVAKVAHTLISELDIISKEFFSNPQEKSSLLNFQRSCYQSIQKAEAEFKNQRSIWSNTPYLLKWIAGALALLTLVPALIVAKKSHHGYVETFFGNPSTVSSLELDSFKRNIQFVFDKLNIAWEHQLLADIIKMQSDFSEVSSASEDNNSFLM
ncbi:hypothetical protein [Legionella saoudiensis]|uniref:hypothetical protein n=1 Tax=Legionella saoudiensis TaxID=1750561 RepID=UPI000731BC9E|nr:hypothetical protein [Legionella saoudiensis]